MLRIFVTGDNHIGRYMKEKNNQALANSRIEAFDAMVQVANHEKCALFIITGDLFENNNSIPQKDIKVLLEMLSNFNGTVIVLPGNHDFYDEDTQVWKNFKTEMEGYDNILLLNEYRTYAFETHGEQIILYPAFCATKHSEGNNLDWIKKEGVVSDGAYRIGIAHGAVAGETIDKEGRYFLMERSELEDIAVDVWLIGHTHVPFPNDLTEEYSRCPKILNAGTHVQTDVSNNTEGQCFVVEIRDDKEIYAKKFVSGNYRFYRKEITLSAGEMENIISRELRGIADNSSVELILSGVVTVNEYENRHAFIEQVLSRFERGECMDSALSRQISRNVIEREFPETSFSAQLLFSLLDEPKEAQLAYELLNRLKEGK